MHRSRNPARWLVVALLLVLGLAAGGSSDGSIRQRPQDDATTGRSDRRGRLLSDAYDLAGANVRLGSKDFTEQLILGQLARQAWEAAGATVTLTEHLPSPRVARDALLAGDLDAAWEYTGTAWIDYLGNDETIADPMAQYEAVAQEDLRANGIRWTRPAPFDDTYALATRQEFADEHGLGTLRDVADLVRRGPAVATLCLDSTFGTRDTGLVRFEDAYGIAWPREQMTIQEFAGIHESTAEGSPCNFGEVFTTDGRLLSHDLVLMEDPDHVFVSYLPAMQIANGLHRAHPDLVRVIEAIGVPLDRERMTRLNAAVDVGGAFPEAVAEQYLRDEGFIE